MKQIFKAALVLFALSATVTAVQAQGPDTYWDDHLITANIPSVMIVDIEPWNNNTISLGFNHDGEAGNPIEPIGPNNFLWLNWSTIKGPTGTDDQFKIAVKAAPLLPGSDITVQIASPSALDGGGQKGTVVNTAPIVLSLVDQDIINDIGSCFTGNGITKGSQITYDLDWVLANYAQLVAYAPPFTMTVTYTISTY